MIQKAFQPHFNFLLKNVSLTVHADWAVDRDAIDMKRSLHRGNSRSLNLYIVEKIPAKNPDDVILGRASWPVLIYSKEYGPSYDGVTITRLALADSTDAPPDRGSGKTAVHEIGHWFGLLHTYQGGCV